MDLLSEKYSERALERKRVGGTHQASVRQFELGSLEKLDALASADTLGVNEVAYLAPVTSVKAAETPVKEKEIKFAKHPDFTLPTSLRDATPAYKRLEREHMERERAFKQYQMELELEEERQRQANYEKRRLRELEAERKRQRRLEAERLEQQERQEREELRARQLEKERLEREDERNRAKQALKKTGPTRWPAPFSTFIPLYTPTKSTAARQDGRKPVQKEDELGEKVANCQSIFSKSAESLGGPKKSWSKILADIESMTLEDIEIPLVEAETAQPGNEKNERASFGWDNGVVPPSPSSSSASGSPVMRPVNLVNAIPLPTSPMFPPSSPPRSALETRLATTSSAARNDAQGGLSFSLPPPHDLALDSTRHSNDAAFAGSTKAVTQPLQVDHAPPHTQGREPQNPGGGTWPTATVSDIARPALMNHSQPARPPHVLNDRVRALSNDVSEPPTDQFMSPPMDEDFGSISDVPPYADELPDSPEFSSPLRRPPQSHKPVVSSFKKVSAKGVAVPKRVSYESDLSLSDSDTSDSGNASDSSYKSSPAISRHRADFSHKKARRVVASSSDSESSDEGYSRAGFSHSKSRRVVASPSDSESSDEGYSRASRKSLTQKKLLGASKRTGLKKATSSKKSKKTIKKRKKKPLKKKTAKSRNGSDDDSMESSNEESSSEASIDLPKTRAGYKSWGIEPDILREYGGRTIVTIRKAKY